MKKLLSGLSILMAIVLLACSASAVQLAAETQTPEWETVYCSDPAVQGGMGTDVTLTASKLAGARVTVRKYWNNAYYQATLYAAQSAQNNQFMFRGSYNSGTFGWMADQTTLAALNGLIHFTFDYKVDSTLAKNFTIEPYAANDQTAYSYKFSHVTALCGKITVEPAQYGNWISVDEAVPAWGDDFAEGYFAFKVKPGAVFDADGDYTLYLRNMQLRLDKTQKAQINAALSAAGSAWTYDSIVGAYTELCNTDARNESTYESMFGDANNDTRVNVADLVRMKRFFADSSVRIYYANGDLSGNETVDAADAVLLRRYLLGEEINVDLVGFGTVPETFDIRTANLTNFIAAAQTYDTNDYAYTLKSSYVGPSMPPSAKTLEIAWKPLHISLTDRIEFLLTDSDGSDDRCFSFPAEYFAQMTSKDATLSLTNLCSNTTYTLIARTYRKDGTVCDSAPKTFTTGDGPRILSIPGVWNARDIGGWMTSSGKRVKQGLVFRSADFNNITAEGRDVLLNQLKVKTEFELRSLSEMGLTSEPTQSTAFGDSVNLLYISGTYYDAYLNAASSSARGLRLFTDPANYPIIFHCISGADRTGTVAYMLKALLGVSENDLCADYELTVAGATNRTRENVAGLVAALKRLPGSTLQEKAYRFYHDTCGMSAMELSNVYNILMTDSAIFGTDSFKVPAVSAGADAVFTIDLRDSVSVTSVTLGGQSVPFTMSGDKLSVTASGSGKQAGVITLNDGEILNFEINVK